MLYIYIELYTAPVLQASNLRVELSALMAKLGVENEEQAMTPRLHGEKSGSWKWEDELGSL